MIHMKHTKSCLVLIVLIGCAILAPIEATRTKRQAQQNARPNNQRPSVPVETSLANGGSSSAISMASSMSANAPIPNEENSSNVGTNRPSGQVRPIRPNARPATNPAANEDFGFDQEDTDSDMPPPPPRRKRPPPRRQKMRPDRYNDDHEDADCDDNEYQDYGNMFHAAFRPMRQMGDMMGNMFEHMQSLASGDFENLPEDANYAVASARSDGSGYSRQSSIVNNNGKRRGIITETRNGRTQTRRIGDDNDE